MADGSGPIDRMPNGPQVLSAGWSSCPTPVFLPPRAHTVHAAIARLQPGPGQRGRRGLLRPLDNWVRPVRSRPGPGADSLPPPTPAPPTTTWGASETISNATPATAAPGADAAPGLDDLLTPTAEGAFG